MTWVTGTIRNSEGVLYEGALIEAQLITQMQHGTGLVGNNSVRTHTDAYGRFWLRLSPTNLDPSAPDNHYVFKVVNNVTNYYFRQVPSSEEPLDFDELPEYTAPDRRTPYFGGIGDSPLQLPTNVDSDYSGLFSYVAIKGDGSSLSFSAPGKVHLVALNGVVQNPTTDYAIVTHNTVEFVIAPDAGDTVLIQYKI